MIRWSSSCWEVAAQIEDPFDLMPIAPPLPTLQACDEVAAQMEDPFDLMPIESINKHISEDINRWQGRVRAGWAKGRRSCAQSCTVTPTNMRQATG